MQVSADFAASPYPVDEDHRLELVRLHLLEELDELRAVDRVDLREHDARHDAHLDETDHRVLVLVALLEVGVVVRLEDVLDALHVLSLPPHLLGELRLERLDPLLLLLRPAHFRCLKFRGILDGNERILTEKRDREVVLRPVPYRNAVVWVLQYGKGEVCRPFWSRTVLRTGLTHPYRTAYSS